MIKAVVLVLAFVMSAVAVQAQKAADFSGKWNLDKAQSKMDERMAASIESMTMTVTQSATELTVANATKRVAPPAGAPAGGPPGGGGGGGGRMGGGGGDTTTKYTLDGKETAVETEGQMGKSVAKYKATVEGSKATLSTSRTFSTPQGEMTQTNKDVWTLSGDGKTLTVNRETTSARGSSSSTLVFTKG